MTDLTWFDAVLGFCVVIVYGAWLGALEETWGER